MSIVLSQRQRNVTPLSRTIAMILDDKMFEVVTESQVLKFTFALYELQHPGKNVLKVVPPLLPIDKGALVQHVSGRGSIGAEGWEILGANDFDLRAYDIWQAAKKKIYRVRK